eukprot:6734106-Pyramimonas_sp.AAC.1
MLPRALPRRLGGRERPGPQVLRLQVRRGAPRPRERQRGPRARHLHQGLSSLSLVPAAWRRAAVAVHRILLRRRGAAKWFRSFFSNVTMLGRKSWGY